MFRFRHKTRREVGVHAADARVVKPQFELHYSNTVQPSAGAMAYALESLSLAPFPPSGPTIATRDPIRPTTRPMYALQSIPLVSLGGTVSGQMAMQPLFNPFGGGYSGPAPQNFTFVPNAVDPTITRRSM